MDANANTSNKSNKSNANTSHVKNTNNLNAAVFAAIDEVHALQERLARGDVSPRRRSPPKHAVDASSSAEARRSPSPPRAAVHKRHNEPRRRELVWISKPLQRWRTDGSAAEPLGTLEFLRGATLADARALVDQFYPLPHKRAYVFYHPALRVPIDQSDEANVDPAAFEILAIVAVHAPTTAATPSPPLETRQTPEKATLPPKQREMSAVSDTKPPRARSVIPRRSVTAVTKSTRVDSSKTPPGEPTPMAPPFMESKLSRMKLGDGAVCDIVIREVRDASVSVVAHVVEGEFAGRSTNAMQFTASIFKTIVQEPKGDGANQMRFEPLLRKLSLGFRKVAGSAELQLVYGGAQRKETKSRQDQIHVAALNTVEPLVQKIKKAIPHPVINTTSSGGVMKSLPWPVHDSIQPTNHSQRRQEISPKKFPVVAPPPSADSDVKMHCKPHTGSVKAPTKTTPVPVPSRHENTLVLSSGASNKAHTGLRNKARAGDVKKNTAPPSDLCGVATSEVEHEDVESKAPASVEIESSTTISSPTSPFISSPSNEVGETHVDAQVEGGDFELIEAVLVKEGAETDYAPTVPSFTEDDDREYGQHDPKGAPAIVPGQPPPESGIAQPENPAPAARKRDPVVKFKRKGVQPIHTEEQKVKIVPDEPFKLDSPTAEPDPLAKSPRRHIGHGSESYAEAAMAFIVDLFKTALASGSQSQSQSRPNEQQDSAESPAPAGRPITEVLVSQAQFKAAFRHYGIDHSVTRLNGALFGIEEELSAWSNDNWESAQEALVSCVMKDLSQVSVAGGAAQLQVFEAALNFAADMIGWTKLTMTRLEIIEKAGDPSFQGLADIGAKRAFRLSDNERSILSRIVSSIPTESFTEHERSLADALEVLYFLVQKHFATIGDMKLQLLPTRELRVKWVIQKLVTLDPSAWRRMELFFYPTIEDYSSWVVVEDRLGSIPQDCHLRGMLLDSDVFLPAFIRFLTKKAAQVNLSISDLVAGASAESGSSTIQRYVVLMKREIETRSWSSDSYDAFLRAFGLKVCDLDTINAERNSHGLPGMSVNGRHSVHTTHQTRLLASVYGLYKRPRWDQPDMMPPPTPNWYTFHGDASIALEYVYVRHAIDLQTIGSRWEDELQLAEKDAANAFRQFSHMMNPSKRANVVCAIGINVLHAQWLHEKMDFTSPTTVVNTHPQARSISIGFHLSKNVDIAAIRVTIRIHADPIECPHIENQAAVTPTQNAVTAINRFVCSASEEALHAFVSAGGLRFLVQCLASQHEELWKCVPFGRNFCSVVAGRGLGLVYAHADIIFFLQSLLPQISRADSTITANNIALLNEVIKFRGSPAEEKVADVAARTLLSLASPAKTGDRHGDDDDVSENGPLRKFLAVDGLHYLKFAIDDMTESSRHRVQLEDALCTIIATRTACTLEGFLVHCDDWMTYFVQPEVWRRSPDHDKVVLIVLDRLRKNVFSQRFVERDEVYCGCGCRGHVSASFSAFSKATSLFCALLKTTQGRIWGARRMQGPLDLLKSVEWTANTPDAAIGSVSKNDVSETLLGMLQQASIGSETCLDACDLVVPRLLDLAVIATSPLTRILMIQSCGLLVDAAMKLSLWVEAPCRFVNLLVTIVSAIWNDKQPSDLAVIAAKIILHEDRNSRVNPPHPPVLSSLLCAEHVAIKTPTSTSSSLLQSLVILLRPSPRLEGYIELWKAPLLVGVISLFSSTSATQLLEEIGIESALHELMVSESSVEFQVLTTRALAAFYLQALDGGFWKPSESILYSKTFGAISAALRLGAKKSLTRRQLQTQVGSAGEPLFGAELEDAAPIRAWYKELMNEMEQDRVDASREMILRRAEEFWVAHEWCDPEGLESFLTHLKLLFVFSAAATTIKSPQIHGELAQILLFLVRFIRDRSHVPEHQVVLYVSSLGNIATALNSSFQQMGFVSTLDLKFFERLLMYSRRAAPLVAHMASRALWALTVAFSDRGLVFRTLSSPLHLVDEEQPTAQKPLSATNGVDILVGSISKKLAAHAEVEGDAATLSLAMERDWKCTHSFFEKNRYTTVTKFLGDSKIGLARGPRSSNRRQGYDGYQADSLSYGMATTRCERDVIQVGRLAHSCLLVISRSEKAAQRLQKETQATSSWFDKELPVKLGDELIRTKTSIVPLLRDEHPLISEIAVRCILVHVISDPERSSELLEPKDLDHLLALGLDCQIHGPLQAASLAVVRLSAIDRRVHESPYLLLQKILRDNARLVRCLTRKDFEVTKQTVELMVLLLAKNDDPRQRAALANAFREVDCQAALSCAFDSLCGENHSERDAASVLQRLVGFVIKLGLVQLIDGDKMVGAMCVGITSHKGEAFLLPMICNCLYDIATQEGKSVHFAKKSRLDAIVGLLSTSLTNGEARHIGATLRTVATEHSGIQRYLSHISSSCLQGVARVLSSFSRASAESIGSAVVSSRTLDDPTFDEAPALPPPIHDVELLDERHLLRVSLEDQILVSLFTDEVYEEFLGLLTTLLASCESAPERFGCTCSWMKRGCSACDPCDLFARAAGPRLVTRLLLARRIFVRLEDTNQQMIEAPGSDAFTIVHSSLQALEILSRSRRCRIDMLNGSTRRAGGWWSVMWLIERSHTSVVQQASRLADVPVKSLMTLGHCAAANGVIDFVFTQREFLISLFSHLATARQDEPAIRCQRASTFLLARLAEHKKASRDLLFREKAAYLLGSLAQFQDRIVQANLLILARNLNYRLPNIELLQVVMTMLQSEAAEDPDNWAVLHLVCDVLTHLLLVRSKPREASSLLKPKPQVLTLGKSSTSLSFSVRTAMAPVWRSLFASFEDDDGSAEFQVLMDEARSISSHLWPTTSQEEPVEALLDFLLRHHLPGDIHVETATHNVDCPKTDDLSVCEDTARVTRYHPSLQYVNSTTEQNTPHKPDNTFHGSIQLWRLVQMLWRSCATGRDLDKQPSQQLPIDRMIGTLLLWSRGDSSDSLSSLSLERRQRLLKFVNDILRSCPEHFKALRLRDVVSMLEVFASRSGSSGVGFELLFLMCHADPSNAKLLVSLFAEHKTHSESLTTARVAAGRSTPESSLMNVLWHAARAGYYDLAVPTSRIVRKSDDIASALSVLEPYVSSPSTAFAMALLDMLSDSSPDVLIGYLKCQSVFVLLELLLLTLKSNDSTSKARHTLNASLLRLIRKTIDVEPNTIRFFRADPRLLLAVQRQIFAVKTATQFAAVELLRCLTTREPSITEGLRRLEDWTASPWRVRAWIVDAIEDHLSRLRLMKVNRKEIVEVAHLVQVPLFACLKTVDLVRLSVAFMESRLAEEDAFMVLSGEGIFSTAPAWMRVDGHKSVHARTTFSQTVESRKMKGLPVLLYKMQKDWYVGGSSTEARHSVAMEIESLDARIASPLDYSAWLACRLGRFLVEDRAEVLRRVSYTKQISPTDISALSDRRWDDTLSLLANAPLMDGVSRDSLACLALAISEPRTLSLDDFKGDGGLVIVYSDGIDYEAQLLDHEDQVLASTVGRLGRGDIIGLPWWTSHSGGSVRLRIITPLPLNQVITGDLPEVLLQSQLQQSEFDLVRDRCQRVEWKEGERREQFREWFRLLAGRPPCPQSMQRRNLQHESLSLMKTLVDYSIDYATAIATNQRLVDIIFGVARSRLHPSIVDAAVDVLIAILSRIETNNLAAAVHRATLSTSTIAQDSAVGLWLPFAIELVREANHDARALQRPLQLLLQALQTSPKEMVDTSAPELLEVATGVLTNAATGHPGAFLDEITQVLSLLIDISPAIVQEVSCSSSVPDQVARLLVKTSASRSPLVFRRLLQLVVFFDEGYGIRKQLHNVFLDESMQRVVQVVAANLFVDIRSIDDFGAASVTSSLAFIGVLCEHVMKASTRKRLEDPQARVGHFDDVLLTAARVILDAFDRLQRQRSLVLRVIAQISDTVFECARLTTRSQIRDGHRPVLFRRYVMQRFQELPSTHTGMISRGGDELLSLVSCIRVMAQIPRAAMLFVDQGFVDLAFRYLLHSPPDVVTDVYISVWTELVRALHEITVHKFETPVTNLLLTHADKIHTLHTRLVAIATSNPTTEKRPYIGCYGFVAALVDLLTALVSKAIGADDLLDGLPWLSVEVAYQCYEWIEQAGVANRDSALEQDDTILKLPLASLRFLSQVCLSASLATVLISQPAFAEALHRMCDQATATATERYLFEGYLQHLCALVEHLVLQPTPLLRDVLPRLLLQAQEMASIASVTLRGATKPLNLSLRLFWLVVFAWRVQGLQYDIALEASSAMMLSTLSGLHDNELLTQRTMLNALGVVSAIVRMAISNSEPSHELSKAIVTTTSRLLASHEASHETSIDETEIASLDWGHFTDHKWQNDTHSSLQFGIASLLIAVLRRVSADKTMQRHWLEIDQDLTFLSAVGLPLALKLLAVRPSSRFILSAKKKSIVFFRSVLSLAAGSPHLQVVRVWRRAVRKPSFIDGLTCLLDDPRTPLGLKLEAIYLLIALTTSSVVDALACAQQRPEGKKNLLTSLVSLMTTSSSPQATVACLDLFTAVAATARPAAQFVVIALRSIGDFVQVFKAGYLSVDQDNVCAALFRCCASISELVVFDEASTVGVMAMNRLMSSRRIKDSDGDLAVTADAIRLVHALLRSEQMTAEVLLVDAAPGPEFWERVGLLLKHKREKAFLQATTAVCSRLIQHQLHRLRSHTIVNCKAAIEGSLLQLLTLDDQLGSALCVQWLQQQSSLPDLDSFVRALCKQLSEINSLSETHQKALIDILPTLLSVLERSRLKFLLSEDTWIKIRDVALAWSNANGSSDGLDYLALCAVPSLLKAKQLRVLHDAARSFRSACRLWHSRFVAPSSGLMIRTARDDATITLGILVLQGVSAALGFASDKAVIQSRVGSLWLTNCVYTELRLASASSKSLELLMEQSLDVKNEVDTSGAQESLNVECMRSVTRICCGSYASRGDASACQRLATALLKTRTLRTTFLELIQHQDLDLVNQLSWTSCRHDLDEISELASTCYLLGELSAEGPVVSRLLSRRLHDQWITAVTYAGDRRETFYLSDANHAFLSFMATVLRYQVTRTPSQRECSVWKPMVLHCLGTLQVKTQEASSSKALALEILTNLIQMDQGLLKQLWRVCLLLKSEIDLGDRATAQGITLRALTDPLRDATTGEDRRRAAFITHGLATSPQRVKPLVHARMASGNTSGRKVYSLCEQLTYALCMCAGTRHRRTVRAAPPDWSSVGSVFSLSLTSAAAETAMWVLRLLLKCLRDKTFTEGLVEEWDLFDQLFAALATSNVDVSSAAAWVLRSAVMLRSTQRDLAKGYHRQRQYRQLGYFEDLRAHESELFTVAPRTITAQALPSRFTMVELWIVYYSRRMTELQSSPDARPHLEAVEEFALYMTSQHFAQIFTSDAEYNDGNGDSTQLLCRAVRERHTALCEALLVIACEKGKETERVRLLALELITVMCSFDMTKYSADVFADAAQLTKLLVAIEDGETETTRKVVVRLVCALLSAAPVKLLFAGSSSSELLRRVESWLSPDKLWLISYATPILRQLVTKSSGTYNGITANTRCRKAHTEQFQSVIMNTARALFEPQDARCEDEFEAESYYGDLALMNEYTASMRVQLMPFSGEGPDPSAAVVVSVILHFFVHNRHGSCLRELRYRGKIRSDRPLLRHQILLEDTEAVVTCEVAMLLTPAKASQPVVIRRLTLSTGGAPFEATHVETLQYHPTSSFDLQLTLSHALTRAGLSSRGKLGRQLIRPMMQADLVSDFVAIITELSKNASIFMSEELQMGHHIIAALEASWRCEGRVDLSPLNALTAWFWSNRSSVAHFRSSWEPLLALVQRMRTAWFIQYPKAAASAVQSTGPTFVATLMEWLATFESDSLTENCLNVLFFENGDVLVRLARHFYPQRTGPANFFFLVATVARVNRLHCEVFARRHALAIMTAMLDGLPPAASSHRRSETLEFMARRSETLEFAARVVAKIARVPTAAYKFLRHGGVDLFGKIAFAIFGDLSDKTFEETRAAAQNLVLASSFLCESVSNTSSMAPAGSTKTDVLALLTTRPEPASQTLSLVDTLLLFLARQSSVSQTTQPQAPPCSSSSSFERLAAVVLRSWIDKWPISRGPFESVIVASAALAPLAKVGQFMDDYTRAICRCIQLTRWDFYSELNIVARTFSVAISAGVRTGVIPIKCRNVFLPFDLDYLEMQRQALTNTSPDAPHSGEVPTAVPSDVVQELRDVLRFVVDHANLAQTLSENRKKTLTSRIKTADSSSRIAMGFHTVLVVVYDTLVDALESVAANGPSKVSPVEASRVILQWLTLLEELGGLVCCAFRELDPTYYNAIINEFRTRPEYDFPAFLLKMERVQSRQQTVAVVLNTMEQVLRSLASKHELRGVTALGDSVAEHAEELLDQYAQTKHQVSVVIALALSGRDAVNRVERGIVAAGYAWRRVFGSSGEAITSFMAGTKESESLWTKIGNYVNAISEFLHHPGPFFKAHWLKLQALVKSLRHLLDSNGKKSETENWSRGSGIYDESSIRDDDGGGDSDARQLGERELIFASLLGLDASQFLVSPVPFMSLESLLDHYGFASTGVKKQISLLNFEELTSKVLQAFATALAKSVDKVAVMSAAELEQELTQLHSQCLSFDDTNADEAKEKISRLGALLAELQGIVDSADLGIHLRVIVQRPVKLSMWQLLLAPVQRARLFSLYHALRRRRGFGLDSSLQRTQLPPLNGIVALQPTTQTPPVVSVFSAITETLTGGVILIKSSVLEALSRAPHHPQQTAKDRQRNRRVAVADDTVANDPFVLLATEPVTRVVANGNIDDPLSDEKLVASLKRKLRHSRLNQQHESRVARILVRILPAKWRYASPPAVIIKATALWRRIKRRVALVLLLLSFWRQEELESDLTNPVLARAFTTPSEREDYFVSTHLRKALDEFVRVWMPESGSLGLPMWQWKTYGVGGTLLCVILACIGPLVASADTSKRNDVMTGLTYALVGVTLLLCTMSIHSITKKHFVLQERNRLRLQPLGKFYPNVVAIMTVLVEIVQLNSITFDPKFNWNENDQLPKFLTWLGKVGISQIGIQQVELKAALCAAELLVWFLLLKCANKFQESNAFLNRVLTKDLPGVLNGTLYMGLVATFFAFLSCVDCSGPYGSKFEKCSATTPPPPPFLVSHQSIPCWTMAHAPLALLGFWGVTFFLPIGLLSQGMNQVLFQQEVLDIKYAPVVMLFSQLVKAVAATARALFPFDTTLLASVALSGNVLLLVLVLRHNGVSLWYVQLIKAGIYAASGWSAACAIYRVETKATTSASNNVMYMGWLGIGAFTVLAVRIWGWRREERENEELARHVTSQRLLARSSVSEAETLTTLECQFVSAAATAIAQPSRRARTLLEKAEKFSANDGDDDDGEAVPVDLRPFMRRARAFASGKQPALGVVETVFMQNARKRAQKLEPQPAMDSVLRARHDDYKTE